jgi:hypothetical protein
MSKMIALFHDEVTKAGKALLAAYEALREMDVRTTEILIALLGRPK